MEPDDTLRLKTQFQMEKEVFPDSVHAMRTYPNKRKSYSEWSKRLSKRLSPRSPTENYLPLTEMDPKKRSTQIVEQWMQSCSTDISLSNRERTPFTDLDPNRLSYLIAEQKENSSKLFLRSSATKKKSDNSLSEHSTQLSRSKSFSLVKGKVSQSKLNENSIIIENESKNNAKKETKKPDTKKTVQKIKNESEEKSRIKSKKAIKKTERSKKSAKTMEGENEVISLGESNSSHLESTIVIEDSQERYVDKDRLACLEVLRAEERQKMRLLGGEGDVQFDCKERTTQNVEQWIQSCSTDISLSSRECTPFTDLDLNKLSYLRAEQKGTTSKMCLRSSATKNKSKLSLSEHSTQSSRSKSFSLVKGKVSQSKLNKNPIIIEKKSRNKAKKETKKPNNKKYVGKVKNGNDEKSRMKAKKAMKKTERTKKSANTMEGENEVIGFGKSNSSHLESTIVIEDSQERYVDKDRLACLEVLRAEERRQMGLLGGEGDIQFDPPEVEVTSFLKKNIDSLREELSQLEAHRKTPTVPSHNKHNMILWSSQALFNVLKDDDKTRMRDKSSIRKPSSKKQLKTVIKQRQRIIQNKRLLKNKVQYLKTDNFNKFVNRNKIIHLINGKRYFKKTHNKSVQTDLPCPTCTCSNVATEETSTTTDLREHQVDTGSLEENIYEICEADEDVKVYCEKESKLNSTTDERSQSGFKLELQKDMHSLHLETADIEISDAESAHNASGDHIVKVLVHSQMPSPEHVDSDNSIISDNRGVFRTLQNQDHSPSEMWEERHRTPPRQVTATSPTYTSPMSNSSSNKENHDPNDTPLKDTKKPEKKKDACKSSAQRPLSLLFEAPLARVYVACSCLRPVEESVVMLLCKQLGWVYCQDYTAELTHLVVAVDSDNKAQRSVKYICAVASGCWVVSYEWAMQSLKQDCHLEEEPFEVLDLSGGSGPRLSRTASAKLFGGLTFCCLPTVTSIRPDILTWIVEAAGARTVEPAALEAARAGPVVLLHERKEEENAQFYKEAVSRWCAQTVTLNYEWVLQCLGHYRLLCPDVYLLQPRGTGGDHVLTWLYEICTPRTTSD